MTTELSVLILATAVLSLACTLVLALRKPMRRHLGASAAYGLWCIPPLCLLGLVLPAAQGSQASPGAVLQLPASVLQVASVRGSGAEAAWWLALWAGGALVCLAWQARRQQRFVRALGALQRLPHARLPLYRAERDAGLPALLGLLRPRIVLPPDFAQRYTAAQRALLLHHERVHWRRGDLPCNALATLLLCLQWFNPFVHLAIRAFRRDQEMACDARVLALRPRQRRAYAEAMLLGGINTLPPLGCPWPSRHPLKERIEMLKQPAVRSRQRLIAIVSTAALATGGMYAAWAAQPRAAATPAAASEVTQGYPLPAPPYPKAALDGNLSGRVVLLVDVRADGSVQDVVVKESQPAGVFDAVTVAAARQWRFRPAMKNGKPVAGQVQVPVTFERHPQAPVALPGGTALATR